MNNRVLKRKKSRRQARYDKALNAFSYIYPKNYDGKVYEMNDDMITINPIPIIIRIKRKEDKVRDVQKIVKLQGYINKDLKIAMFRFRHGDMFTITKLMPQIATLLGIQYSLRKLLWRTKNETRGNITE